MKVVGKKVVKVDSEEMAEEEVLEEVGVAAAG